VTLNEGDQLDKKGRRSSEIHVHPLTTFGGGQGRKKEEEFCYVSFGPSLSQAMAEGLVIHIERQ